MVGSVYTVFSRCSDTSHTLSNRMSSRVIFIYDILDGCVLLVSTQHGEKMDLFVILSYIGSFATVVFCCVYAFVKSRQPEEEVEE